MMGLFRQAKMRIRAYAVPFPRMPGTGAIAAALLFALGVQSVLLPGTKPADQPPTGPLLQTGYHLTARPWQPLKVPKERYLDVIEGVCRYSIRHQDASGAIIDPFLKREHQYAT